jgi:hypothetical protein
MRTTLLNGLALFLFVPLAGCIGGEECDGKDEIHINPQGSANPDGTVRSEPCVTTVSTSEGVTSDYSECCPSGYDYVAYTTEGVLCERDCTEETAQAVANAGFVAHAVADAVVEAVDDLANAP